MPTYMRNKSSLKTELFPRVFFNESLCIPVFFFTLKSVLYFVGLGLEKGILDENLRPRAAPTYLKFIGVSSPPPPRRLYHSNLMKNKAVL